MPSYQLMQITRTLLIFLLLLPLAACDFINNLTNAVKTNTGSATPAVEEQPIVELSFAAASYTAWMPWYLAKDEDTYATYQDKYRVNIQFVSSDYADTINQYISGTVDAVAITNIDAIAQLVKQDVESDVVLIMSASNGNDALLLPANANTNIRGKTIGLVEYSARHYLLDRYLVRYQIDFNDIKLANMAETNLPDALLNNEVYGIVTSNPNVERLVRAQQAGVLFDSRQVSNEILDLIVIRRDKLIKHPGFAQALLAIWFTTMERLQGNRRGPTLDRLAQLAGLTREEYDRQMQTVLLNDTPTKALSSMRDRRSMTKAMRHIRYFMQRHGLVSDDTESYTDWVSFPGRTPALLHYNGQALQDFVAPPKGDI
ncbi:ABC-type nitrate/sulfonate/bicarbonate transport system, periplasmic component [Beggiatoa alba B18LD]|uniref:ABC-type nitrate/sulfonate/bicarbonate transport system, periplasmic component n=1 Tax=Beggiatoa alba B18LD TaxID=395493 RepID=I3CJK7_9GAMM|nr:ABC transporter substrate-binding protein [Beggiatoa alba]EIJ43800.1 ABC-type nitrate/sulfonate/bicarbonate transport system, periplasmic component [Beggiatoa alba B18LD]